MCVTQIICLGTNVLKKLNNAKRLSGVWITLKFRATGMLSAIIKLLLNAAKRTYTPIFSASTFTQPFFFFLTRGEYRLTNIISHSTLILLSSHQQYPRVLKMSQQNNSMITNSLEPGRQSHTARYSQPKWELINSGRHR